MNTEIGRVEGHRKFCNKLWNATKFCLFRMDLVNLEGVRQKSNFTPNKSGLVSEGRSGGLTVSEKQGFPADFL
jgi:valyl-tRNA synthetase